MGRLENGSMLMDGADADHFRRWLKVAAATTARGVVLEDTTTADHNVRMRLAVEVMVSPNIVVDRLVTAVATDSQVTANPPVFNDAAEAVIQQKVNEVWTTIAKLMYPDVTT